MKRTPKNNYYVDRTKLWAFLYLSGFSDNSNESKVLRTALRKEFNVSVAEEKRFNLKKYIQDFMDGELISLEGPVQSYEKQRKLFAEAVVRMSDEYGWKSLVLNENDIWTRDGSVIKGRFIELFSALQKEGYITVKAFSDIDGVIFDVTPKLRSYIRKEVLRELPSQTSQGLKDDGLKSPMALDFDYNSKTREIKVNGIITARPYFDSPNDNVMQILSEKQDGILTREELGKDNPKTFNAFLNEIGIKGTVRKYLFRVSKDQIRLTKKVIVNDPDDIKKLRNEMKLLKKKRG